MGERAYLVNAEDKDNNLGDALNSCEFFQGFPEKQFQAISKIAKLAKIEKNTFLIKQGEFSSGLFFLVSGQISVHNNANKLATVNKKGEFVGELNLYSDAPSISSYICESACVLIFIPIDELKNSEDINLTKFEESLFTHYALSLNDLLEESHDKARSFEIVNNRLQETQAILEMTIASLETRVEERTRQLEEKNVSLEISIEKLKRVYENRDFAYEQFEKVYQNFIMPMIENMKTLEKEMGNELPMEIRDTIGQLKQVKTIFEHLNKTFNNEKIVSKKNVLLIHGKSRRLNTIKMALMGADANIHSVRNEEELAEALEQTDYDVYCFTSDVMELGHKCISDLAQKKIIIFALNPIVEILGAMKHLRDDIHIVSLNSEDRFLHIKNISTVINKIVSDDIFGHEKYLNWGVDSKIGIIKSSQERGGLVKKINEYFEGFGLREPLRQRIRTVLEELMMNVIYDAPVDEKGKSKYNHLSRKIKVDLNSSECGIIRYACDGLLASVSTIDPFGKLTRDIVVGYFEACKQGEVATEHIQKGGGGLGLFQIINLADMVIFNVKKGEKTEVIALFRVDTKNAVRNEPIIQYFYSN